MSEGIEREAALPRRLRDDYDTAPTQQRMGPERIPRRNPSTDQKKARTQQARQTKESTMTVHAEADLLARMHTAATLDEQKALAAELAAVRQAKAADARMQRERGISAAAMSHLAAVNPGQVVRHTTASDWLSEAADVAVDTRAVEASMRAEASVWYAGLHEAVKADGAELAAQTEGKARRLASAHGLAAQAAFSAFTAQVEHQHTVATRAANLSALAAEEVQKPPYGVPSGSSLPAAVDNKSTFDDSLLTAPGGADPQTEPGDAPSLSEGDAPEGDTSQGVENPAVDSTHDTVKSTEYTDPLTSGGTASLRAVADDQTSTEADKGDTPSLSEGDSPEGDHAEPVIEPAKGTGHDAGPGNDSATDSIDGTLYRQQASLKAVAAAITPSEASFPFVQALAQMDSVEQSIAGVPGRDVVAYVLRTAALTDGQRATLEAHLAGQVVRPFSREAADGDQCPSCGGSGKRSTHAPNCSLAGQVTTPGATCGCQNDPCPKCGGTGKVGGGEKTSAVVRPFSREASGPEDQADAAMARWDKHDQQPTVTVQGKTMTVEQAKARLKEIEAESGQYGDSDGRVTEANALRAALAGKTAGINNPSHYTDYSKECAKGDGVGCDGSIEGHPGASCDCPCHGQNAPDFKNNDEVREWHNPSFLKDVKEGSLTLNPVFAARVKTALPAYVTELEPGEQYEEGYREGASAEQAAPPYADGLEDGAEGKPRSSYHEYH